MRLLDKVAIITGGGSGMGRASAILFAKEGAKVGVADIDAVRGQETVDTINAAGGTALLVRTDVSNEDDVAQMVRRVVEAFGKLNIVFNVAGFPQVTKPVETITEEEWQRIMDVNVKSIFLTAKYAVAELKKAGNGVILTTGSVGGLRPRPGSVAYAASKGAVMAITKALAIELAPYNIRANCINPGPTDTPMLPKFIPGFTEEIRKQIASDTPLGRLVTPEDVACAALFLASDEASKITGVALNVDSGLFIARGKT